MSSCSLIEWFEHLLFGSTTTSKGGGGFLQPPAVLYKLVLRLESEGIYWQDTIQKGGLTAFRYNVNGDIDILMDYLDRPSDTSLPVFKTRVVTLFFNHLLAFLANRKLEPVLEQDQIILEKILGGESGSFRYASAFFWGELARGWISRRRPFPETLCQPVPRPVDNTARLYDLTCAARGDRMDPMSMVMLPASEHVNPAHWQSDTLLEAFVRLRPDHVLSRTVQHLVRRAVHQCLEGLYPTCLVEKDDTISNFLQNVFCIDQNVRKVSLVQKPPLVVDVFQRLLALVQLDDLWLTTTTAQTCVPSFPKTDVMQLTEQLLLADRQNKILLRHIQE